MRDRSRDLLARAAEQYDTSSQLAHAARAAIGGGFTSGAAWMGLALAELRGGSPARVAAAETLGWVKYGVSALAAGVPLIVAIVVAFWPLALLAVPVFYAVEAQWVFAFPLALDGARHPLRDARALTRRAGGTLAVMRIVMPIAATMMFGVLVGRGFVRSWCIGCIAIVLWYEATRGRPR